MKKVFLLLMLWLQIASSHSMAATHDFVAERAYYEDQSNKLGWSEVQEKSFTAFSGMLSKGYSNSTFWVRLKISAATEPSLVLKIQPTYLDEIQLFDPAQPARFDRLLGDRFPYTNNERNSLTYDFVIPATSEPRYVLLRLKTTSTNLMQISVVNESDALQMDRKLEIISSAIFSALLVFLFWALIHWWVTRERLVGVFIIRQVLGIAFFAGYVGYTRIALSDHVPAYYLDLGLSFFVMASTTSAIWFHGEFFKDYLISRWLSSLFTLAIGIFFIEMVLFLAGKVSIALSINMLIVLTFPWVMLLISLFAVPWHKLKDSVYVLPKSYLVGAHLIYVIMTSLTTLPSLALASGSVFSPHAVLLHAFVTALVLIFMIYYRAKRIEEKQAVDIALAQQNALNERTKREEQARFLEMLTHEIKTSLAVLKMALGSLDLASKEGRYANRAIDSMNDVIERCAQVQALTDGQVAIEFDEVDLVGLLGSIASGTHSPERISLVSELPVSELPVRVRSDEKLLRVILSNLIDNALKYSKPQSVVCVDIKANSQEIIVAVSNQVGSAGMPDKNKVFTKYYRSERAHEQIGSGLGLYLTAQFANMLGMHLSYVSKPDVVEFDLCLKRSA